MAVLTLEATINDTGKNIGIWDGKRTVRSNLECFYVGIT